MSNTMQYPIGVFVPQTTYTTAEITRCIEIIAQLPTQVAALVDTMTDTQLDTAYRPNGWTARQVIHHLADSHANSFIRFKLALTEHHPVIKPYLENLWAALPDSQHFPVRASLLMLEGIHTRWVVCLEAMQAADWARGFYHPEKNRVITLAEAVALYAWHCQHHLGHLQIVATNA